MIDIFEPRKYETDAEVHWKEFAACRGKLDTFFPKRGDNQMVVKAKLICTTCNVQQECLEYALNNGDIHGIWGGKSERQRRIMRRNIRLGESSQKLHAL